MRIAILANNANSFIKPTAEGLQRMLEHIGVHSTIFYQGLSAVRHLTGLPRQGPFEMRVRGTMQHFLKEGIFYNLLRQLRRYDVVVVVNNMPRAFMRENLRDREIRRFLGNIPVVLYGLHYLPTRGPWAKWLLEGNPRVGVQGGGNWGLERYDWYFMASVVSEYPLPRDCHIYSHIGVNLDDGSLRPETKEAFVALIDFERPAHLRERAVQIAALEETNTKYIVLHGEYPITEIRKLYRKCSMYFVAHRESFGLPICELQACGAYIFTPYADWCPSHWLKGDLSIPGPGKLSPNFIVYDNDKQHLIESINHIKSIYNPQNVFETFTQYHNQLFYGNLDALKGFVQKVQAGEIHGALHNQHPSLASLVAAIGL